MRMHTKISLLIAAVLATSVSGAYAQKMYSRSNAPIGRAPGNDHPIGGYRGPGFGMPGIILAVPSMVAPDQPYVDDNGPPPRRQRNTQRRARTPVVSEDFVPNEVLIRFVVTPSARQIATLQRRYRLARIDSWTSQLSGVTSYRWRIRDGRPVPAVVRTLQRDTLIASVQPNYLYALQEDAGKAELAPAAKAEPTEGDPSQYELGKLHLPQAHALAKGDNVLVAVIDSAVDADNAELAGSIAEKLDVVADRAGPDKHGTAVAGLIAAHRKLMGAAPNAKILAVRAFDKGGSTTDNIRKGIDWAATHGARVINMSFAGKHDDPALQGEIAAAYGKGIVLVAAAGNDGPKSPRLYPGAYPQVIAVAATDANDALAAASSHGDYVAIAAPGEKMLLVGLHGPVVDSGTSFAAPLISGIAALMLQSDPALTPDELRAILQKTAKDLGAKGRDPEFGWGLADAFAALTAARASVASTVPVEPANTSSGAH